MDKLKSFWQKLNELYGAHRYEEAAQILESLLVEYPLHKNIYINLAACQEKLGSIDAAIETLYRPLDIVRSDMELHRILSRLLYFKGGMPLTEQIYRQKRYPKAAYYFVSSLNCWQVKEYKFAATLIGKAYVQLPDDLEICKVFCELYELTKTPAFDALYSAANTILEQESDNVMAHRILGIVHEVNENYVLAISEYQKVYDLEPSAEWAKRKVAKLSIELTRANNKTLT